MIHFRVYIHNKVNGIEGIYLEVFSKWDFSYPGRSGSSSLLKWCLSIFPSASPLLCHPQYHPIVKVMAFITVTLAALSLFMSFLYHYIVSLVKAGKVFLSE